MVPTLTPTATVVVSTFFELSAAIASNTHVKITRDIQFPAQIYISGITNLAITSDNGAALTSDRSFDVVDGGLFDVDGNSDVTFTGVWLVSGSADYGGCVFVYGGSTVETNGVHFVSCEADVRTIQLPSCMNPFARWRKAVGVGWVVITSWTNNMISFTLFMGNRNWVVELEFIPCMLDIGPNF